MTSELEAAQEKITKLVEERDRYRNALRLLNHYTDSLRYSGWSGLANVIEEALQNDPSAG